MASELSVCARVILEKYLRKVDSIDSAAVVVVVVVKKQYR